MEKKTWHEWLNSLGMVIALALAGVTFYYQFLRTPRELTGVVLPLIWNDDGTVTVRLVIRNGGGGDEVVEAVYLSVLRGPKQQIFATQVVRPGEAKVLRAAAKLERVVNDPLAMKKHSGMADGVWEGATVEIHVVDRTGHLLVNSEVMTVVGSFHGGEPIGHFNLTRTEGRSIDLLSGQSWAARLQR